MRAIEEELRPGVDIRHLQSVGRRVLEKSGIGSTDEALIFFHGLGLSHADQAQLGVAVGEPAQTNWTVEEDFVMSTHILLPGDHENRVFLEDIARVTPHGGEGFFTWDFLAF